ncbi:type II secretion system F family protein [Alcaligenes parafaecalis]|uniref:Type II secretion system F family protein n=1 Tax=Alcaligenes parafaecalis TaxID=171260 RepID=A0ABT3VLW7_9BURK|nr:type II secretion system F family protein [Alcaligenes parafaecalis]MCX5463484.1 type II secretion system F family protein [Alcaligenes parafaecalis]
MKFLSILLTVFGTTALAYLLLRLGQRLATRYRQQLLQQSEQSLQSHFVFVRSQYLAFGAWAVLPLVFLVAWWLIHSLWLAVLIALIAAVTPLVILRWMGRRRLEALRRQLPDFVLSLALSLQAGLALQAALQQLAQSLPAPLGQELRLLLRQQRLGLNAKDSYQDLLERVPVSELAMFVSAMQMGQSTGAGLGERLKILAQTIRARLTIEEKIVALTAQARLQARIMFCLPGFVAGALYLLDATAFEQAWFNTVGVWVAGGIVAMLMMGLWWMQVILRGEA